MMLKREDGSWNLPGMEEMVLNVVVGAFLVAVLGVLPLYYRNFYLDLPEVKYRFYYLSVFVALAAVLLVRLCFRALGVRGRKRMSWSCADIMMAAFWGVCGISTLLSDYRYEAFWGNEGAWVGFFLISVFGIAYLCVTKTLKFRRWYLDIFLIAALAVSFLGIAQFFDYDILHFKAYLNEKMKKDFMSTIGNINLYTAYLALPMAVAATLFATAKKKLSMIWYYVCMVFLFAAMFLGISDNAYLSMLALFAFLPLYLFSKKCWLRRYVVILASWGSVVLVLKKIISGYTGTMMAMDSIFRAVTSTKIPEYATAGLWILAAGLYVLCAVQKTKGGYEENISKKLRYVWAGILTAGVVGVLAVMIDINLFGNAARYGSLGNALYISDAWGTYRGWVWKKGMEVYGGFPLKDKLVGYGPETFGVIMTEGYYSEMAAATQQKYMWAHNQYIQYLVTTGIVGLLSYLGLLGAFIYRMVKKSGENKVWVMPVVFALICYNVQNIVNFDSAVITPIYWTLMFLGLSGCDKIYKNLNK